MYKLDHYTTKLIALMMAKGGVIGTKLKPFMDRLSRVGLFKIVMQGESLSYAFFSLTHTLSLLHTRESFKKCLKSTNR